jgi:hypothetical protein
MGPLVMNVRPCLEVVAGGDRELLEDGEILDPTHDGQAPLPRR